MHHEPVVFGGHVFQGAPFGRRGDGQQAVKFDSEALLQFPSIGCLEFCLRRRKGCTGRVVDEVERQRRARPPVTEMTEFV